MFEAERIARVRTHCRNEVDMFKVQKGSHGLIFLGQGQRAKGRVVGDEDAEARKRITKQRKGLGEKGNILFFFFFFFFFVFLGLHSWHMEVPRLRVQLEL